MSYVCSVGPQKRDRHAEGENARPNSRPIQSGASIEQVSPVRSQNLLNSEEAFYGLLVAPVPSTIRGAALPKIAHSTPSGVNRYLPNEKNFDLLARGGLRSMEVVSEDSDRAGPLGPIQLTRMRCGNTRPDHGKALLRDDVTTEEHSKTCDRMRRL